MSKEKIKKENHTSHFALYTSNKGITLVAIIITIVVMLILIAVTLSLALGGNGVLKISKEAKEETEIAAEKEKLQDAVFATAGKSGEVNLDKIVLPEGFIEISGDENKVIYQGPSGQLYEVENITGKITEIDEILDEEIEKLEITTETQGVTFTKSDGVTPGDPNNLKNGDIVIYGDYKYTYSSSNQGWAVAVLDKTKEKYGKIAEEIYGKPIISLSNTFRDCTNLVTAPDIPSTVTNMNCTFVGCTNLTESSDIPIGVKDLSSTFYNCKNLKMAPKLPEGITSLNATFLGCTSLTEVPEIPNSVINLKSTFSGCSSLTITPEIPSSVVDMESTFFGCSSLTNPPEIPNSVTNMNATFKNCISLTVVPIIPNGITDLRYTFQGCSSLTTAPEIPENIEDLSATFAGCSSLTTAPILPDRFNKYVLYFFSM